MKAVQKQANNHSNRSATEATQGGWQNQLAQVANNSKEAVAQRALISGINDSPRMLAQRRQIESYIGADQQQPIVPTHPTSQISQQPIQRLEKPDDEEKEPLQGKFVSESPAQLKESVPKTNNTGLPDHLKSGIESLSGLSMDNVKVHYNSSQPAQLNALAYAQGTDIHVAPGQKQHLPHEAWHVVQQAQGRVQPTMQMKNGVPVNDDKELEHEADAMGGSAAEVVQAAEKKARPDSVRQRTANLFGTHGVQQNRAASMPVGAANSKTVQLISEGDARERLGVAMGDTNAANTVEIIRLLHQIIDEMPTLEAALALYPTFLGSHAGRTGLAAKKSDLQRWMGGAVKFITDKLASYLEVLEGIEDWYTEEPALTRNFAAATNIAMWRTEQAAFHDNIAPIATLLNEQASPLYEQSESLVNGIKSLARIQKLLGDWLKGGGGFSALGRAHDIKTEIVATGVASQDGSLVKDNSFLAAYALGQGRSENAATTQDVYKANQVEAITGPLIVTGRSLTPAENGNRAPLLKYAEAGMALVQTGQNKKYTATPAPCDRGKGQHYNMNNTNARGYAWLINMQGWNSSQWEWLHVKAASLGGVTDSTNLILGTRDANTHMMPFESNVRTLASLVHKHPQLKDLTVEWNAHYKHPSDTVKHAYELISISWVVHPEASASDDLKTKAADAGGKAIFDVLHTESMLSKSEVQRLETTLFNFRETLQTS